MLGWDYTDSEVLLLTNYHTWDSYEFNYCFPPMSPKSTSKPKGTKRKVNEKDDNNVVLILGNDRDFKHEFVVTSGVFHSWQKDDDFVVLKLPKAGFTMPRIIISLATSLTHERRDL